MKVSLTPELEEYIQHKVESGLYASTSEVVRDGLRLLIQHENFRLEAAYLEGEQTAATPLTKGDWQQLRRCLKEARGSRDSRSHFRPRPSRCP